MPQDLAENRMNATPLRIVGIVVGVLVMAASLAAWFPYLGASLTGFDSQDFGPGVTNKDLVQAFFGFWITPWAVGLVVVLASITGWLRRTTWLLLGLTGIMLVISLVTYLIGAACFPHLRLGRPKWGQQVASRHRWSLAGCWRMRFLSAVDFEFGRGSTLVAC